MTDGNNDSCSIRLVFWFLWLSSFAIGCYFIWQMITLGVWAGLGDSALPFFLGFFLLMAVQLLSLKAYQHLQCSIKPLFIQLSGYVILLLCTAIKLSVSA